ncbi:MAG: type II secretion system protein [Candidatus Yanofskybacteria bacterium]|nr:type II secretion system protein [Candidatus Yanofskybacteria bacterium]
MNQQKGFTLIELLVVIAIIGILSGIVLVSLGGARSSARDARQIAEIQAIGKASELFYNTRGNGAYPAAANIGAVATILLPEFPVFPASPTSTPYAWVDNTGNTQEYCAYATLEEAATAPNVVYFVANPRATGKRTSDAAPTLGTNCNPLSP